jgi:hypothetical protein
MLPSLSALVFTGCFSPYDWPSKDTSPWGRSHYFYLEMEDYTKALGKTRETNKRTARASDESSGAGERGDDSAGGWSGRSSAWQHSGEPRRCKRGHRQ